MAGSSTKMIAAQVGGVNGRLQSLNPINLFRRSLTYQPKQPIFFQSQNLSMATLGIAEQKLFIDVLKTVAVPMVRDGVSWKSIDVWNAVCNMYNTKALVRGLPQRDWITLVKLGKRLTYCNCNRVRDLCICIIPEFPDVDGHGEPSSRVSLGLSYSYSNNISSTEDMMKRSQLRVQIADVLVSLEAAKQFKSTQEYDKMEVYNMAIDAWEHQLKEKKFMRAEAFLLSATREKMKLTNYVIKKYLQTLDD